jgi:hypothetical protein
VSEAKDAPGTTVGVEYTINSTYEKINVVKTYSSYNSSEPSYSVSTNLHTVSIGQDVLRNVFIETVDNDGELESWIIETEETEKTGENK